MYDSIKNMVEFQNNSLFNKFFISKSLTEDNNGTKPYMDPLVNITIDTDYNDGNYDTIKKLYTTWCDKFYNIIDNNMYCWFDINKSNKKIKDETGEERIIPSYSVVMVNKTCHQFIDYLTKNMNMNTDADPTTPYIEYYKNILQARNAIEKIYTESGRQFWPARIPRNGGGLIINTELVIKLYTMFEGVLSSLDMVFNISNINTINKVKQVLNEIINKFEDGTLLMTRSEVSGSLSQSVDDFDFKLPTQNDEDELFKLVNETKMPTSQGGINDAINKNYKDTTATVTDVKKSKKRKREENAVKKAEEEKQKRDKRSDRLKLIIPEQIKVQYCKYLCRFRYKLRLHR
jgi:hypothetical protein